MLFIIFYRLKLFLYKKKIILNDNGRVLPKIFKTYR